MPFGIDRASVRDLLHAGIHDRGGPHVQTVQRRHQARGIAEALRVPGEIAQVVRVIDVEVDRVDGNVVVTKIARDLDHLVGGLVAPPRLVVTQGPQRRQRRNLAGNNDRGADSGRLSEQGRRRLDAVWLRRGST